MRPELIEYTGTFAARVILGSALMLAAGCGQRGEIALVPADMEPSATVSQIVVATARMPAPAPEFFSAERSYAVNFASFGVSIPSDRKLGEVTFPKGNPDPSTDFLVASHQSLSGEREFIQAINAANRWEAKNSDQGTLFVHGYNNNFAEGLYRNAQLSHDLQTPGVDVFFSWPSGANLTAYLTDRESVLFSRDALAETISALSKSQLSESRIVGHSMGAFLVMETLRTLALQNDKALLRKISAVVLISADIEIDVFRKQAPPVLAAGIPIYVVVSSDDKALAFSARLRGQKERLGSIRSVDELGGLDVTVVDLSDVKSEDMAGHLKIGTSPEVIALIQSLRAQGLSVLSSQEKPGLIDSTVGLLRIGPGGVMSSPASQ